MRFQRYLKHEFKRTRLKDLAAERRLRKEREAFPLFADDIDSRQPTVDEIMAKREQAWAKTEREWRAARAAKWRDVRKTLFSLEPGLRHRILEEWNRHKWYPGDPSYLLCLIQKRLKDGFDS